MKVEIESELVSNGETWEIFFQAELFEKLISPRYCNFKNEHNFPVQFNLLAPMS